MALRILAILVIATILTGCGSASHKPPTTTDFSRDTTVQADFDSTWSNVVKWAALNNVPLDKVDKEDGLLSSQRGLAAGGVLDCGEAKGKIAWASAKLESVTANLNIIVENSGDRGTTVTMGLFGSGVVAIRNGIGAIISSEQAQCVSTGSLESSLFNYLHSRGK